MKRELHFERAESFAVTENGHDPLTSTPRKLLFK
jgi:hypothetical protein